MITVKHGVFAAALLALVACGQQQPTDQPTTEIDAPVEETDAAQHVTLPPVDAALVGVPSSEFTAIEPTEIGIAAAPTVMEALEPLLGPEMSEGSSLSLTITAQQNDAIADVVRAGMADDSVSAGHLRVEFRREPDGWFPTNAYRRSQCARGGQAGQWTAGLCP
jgi:hypothetical protein